MYVSIDLVEEVIERQLRKYKNKLVAREQEGGNFKQEFFEEDDKIEDAGEIKIVRTKKFGFKPMYPEDACVQMELLGHDFYVFCNAESDEVNVVYRRKNGTFGLIEPEFSGNAPGAAPRPIGDADKIRFQRLHPAQPLLQALKAGGLLGGEYLNGKHAGFLREKLTNVHALSLLPGL